MTDAEFEAQVDHMKREGYTVLPNVLTPEECDTVQRELDRLYKDRDRGGFECLFNKASIFERFYMVPALLRVVRHFLGHDAIMMGEHGSIIEQGDGGNGLHADGAITGQLRERSQAPVDEGKRITSHAMGLNTIWCISEFTNKNGATCVTPGSHKVESLDVPKDAHETARIIEVPRGSVIVFITTIWHGSSKNQTEDNRYAVLMPWRRNWAKGLYEMARVVKPEVLDRAGEDGKYIFGIDAMPPYLELWQWDREKGEPKSEFVHLKRD